MKAITFFRTAFLCCIFFPDILYAHQTEKAAKPELTAYQKENEQLNSFTKAADRLSITDKNLNIASTDVAKNVDYIDPLFFNANITKDAVNYSEDVLINNKVFKKEGSYTSTQLKQASFIIGDVVLDNVKCIKVLDKYELESTGPNSRTFHYDNSYYHLYDRTTNVHIASINYISLKTGFLGSEYKFIQINPEHEKAKGINTKPAVAVIPSIGNNLTVYPNPAHSSISVEYSLTNDEVISLGIYDLNGKLLRAITQNEKNEAGAHKKEVSDIHLPAGVYYVQLFTGSTKTITKLIIQ